MKPPDKGKLDGVVLLGFAEKKSSSKVEMVDFWTFWLKTTSKQVATDKCVNADKSVNKTVVQTLNDIVEQI